MTLVSMNGIRSSIKMSADKEFTQKVFEFRNNIIYILLAYALGREIVQMIGVIP